jgi:hypothetical protein
MQLLRVSPSVRATLTTFGAAAVATLATLFAVGIAQRVAVQRDPCALPPGVAGGAEIAGHAMACRDLEQHRISLAEYRRLIGLDLPPAPPQPTWASSVRSSSSEYSQTSWSAAQALGAPNVYPRAGDAAQAWASRDADAATEFLEVGFAQPMRAREILIYETYNPGAIGAVELVTASGARIPLGQRTTEGGGGSQITRLTAACSDEPIVGVRITVESGKVPGWNEIDAVGALPCL